MKKWLICTVSGLIVILYSMDSYAQNNNNFRKLQEISFDQIYQEKQKSKSNSKPQQQEEQIELSINDSIFKLFDVDIDLTCKQSKNGY